MIRIKDEKAVVMSDVIIGIIIIILLGGIVGSLFYQIAYNNTSVKLNAIAVYYAIKTAEYIDEIPYEQVNNSLDSTIVSKLNEKYSPEKLLSDSYIININVQNYDTDGTKEDIIKKVKITVSYNLLGQQKEYEISKLKIKET